METKFLILFALLVATLFLFGCIGAGGQQAGAQQPSGSTLQGSTGDPGVELAPEIDNVTVDEGN